MSSLQDLELWVRSHPDKEVRLAGEAGFEHHDQTALQYVRELYDWETSEKAKRLYKLPWPEPNLHVQKQANPDFAVEKIDQKSKTPLTLKR